MSEPTLEEQIKRVVAAAGRSREVASLANYVDDGWVANYADAKALEAAVVSLRRIPALEAENARLREVLAKVAPDPGNAPCVCTERAGDGVWLLQCDCDNTGDRVDMAFWCAAKTLHERVTAALTPAPEDDEKTAKESDNASSF